MEHLVQPSERLLFVVLLLVSIATYVVLVVSIIGIAYLVGAVVFMLFLNGLAVGYIRGNAVRVSESQLPEVHAVAKDLAQQMQLGPVPPVYVLQQGRLLNAFAMRLLAGRNFVVLYSDVLELAYQEGQQEVAFVIAHELAHIKRGHTTWRWLLYPALAIPFLGHAYSRATEFTADRFGAHFCPRGAIGGLLVLAAGKRLYSKVNVNEFAGQTQQGADFWAWLAEALSTHPFLPRRIGLVQRVAATS